MGAGGVKDVRRIDDHAAPSGRSSSQSPRRRMTVPRAAGGGGGKAASSSSAFTRLRWQRASSTHADEHNNVIVSPERTRAAKLSIQ